MMQPTDAQLVQHLRNGEQSAFSLLHERYHSRLRSFLQNRLQLGPEQAEDFAQDVFELLMARDYAALKRWEGRATLYTYLCTIALRHCYRRLRRTPPVVDAADDALPEPAADPTDQGLAATDVRQAMEALPDQFRTALVLHHFGGLEYHEIAELTGVPANTIATRICRAKRRLRELLSR